MQVKKIKESKYPHLKMNPWGKAGDVIEKKEGKARGGDPPGRRGPEASRRARKVYGRRCKGFLL